MRWERENENEREENMFLLRKEENKKGEKKSERSSASEKLSCQKKQGILLTVCVGVFGVLVWRARLVALVCFSVY